MTFYRDEPPPHSLDAERALLGSMILKPDLIADPVCRVEAADFYFDSHRRVYETLACLFEAGTPADAVTLAEALAGSDGSTEADAGRLALELMASTPHAHHADHYAEIIREHAERRRIVLALPDLAAMARNPDTPLAKLRETAEAILPNVAPRRPTLAARKLSDVTSRPVDWLWPGRIPLGKLSLIAGDPGLGKSFLSVDLAARISIGRPWPDATWNPSLGHTNPVGSTVLFSAEDDPEDTIRPRLDAAEGDPDRVFVVDGVTAAVRRGERPRSFCLETDLPALDALLESVADCRLVVIDPISAYGNGSTDTHRNADVRAMLAPLSDLAARRRVAVVAVTHLNKGGGGKAVYRATGSLAYIAAARTGWMVIRDKDDSTRRLLLPVKNNLAPDFGGLAYRIDGGRLAWEPSPVEMHGDDALAMESSGSDDTGERDDAERWLADFLAAGPAPSRDVTREATKEGIGNKALRRARERLCDRPYKSGFGDGSKWLWRLKSPQHFAEDAPADAKMPEDARGWDGATSGNFELDDPFGDFPANDDGGWRKSA